MHSFLTYTIHNEATGRTLMLDVMPKDGVVVLSIDTEDGVAAFEVDDMSLVGEIGTALVQASLSD